MKRKWFFVVAPLGFAAFIAIGGVVVLLLWNWLAPTLFGLSPVTFWQAIGLLALCRILFGNFGIRSSSHSNMRRRMAKRWEHMTPEEREKVRQRFGGWCGPIEPPHAEPTP